mgnify:FL=1
MTNKSNPAPLGSGEQLTEYAHIRKKIGRDKKKAHKAKVSSSLKTTIKNKHNVTNSTGTINTNQTKIAMNYPNESIYMDTFLYRDLISRMILDIKDVIAKR